MKADLLIGRILGDEGLTEGLADPEAKLLIEWLVGRAEQIAANAPTEADATAKVEALCKKARGIRKFVLLWCYQGDQGAAIQLAAADRSDWPLPPSGQLDGFEVMQRILQWEEGRNRTGGTPPGAGA